MSRTAALAWSNAGAALVIPQQRRCADHQAPLLDMDAYTLPDMYRIGSAHLWHHVRDHLWHSLLDKGVLGQHQHGGVLGAPVAHGVQVDLQQGGRGGWRQQEGQG